MAARSKTAGGRVIARLAILVASCWLWLAAPATASFDAVAVSPQLTVTKGGSGSGSVTSTPSGIDCGATCTASFDNGTSVTLHGIAAAGSTFAGWSGGGCSGTDDCTLIMDADKTVTATFKLRPDKTPPVARLSIPKHQRIGRLYIVVRSDEAAAVRVRGQLRVLGASKAYRFKAVMRQVPANRLVRLSLKLSKKAVRTAKRALARRKTLRMKLTLTATDSAGNTSSQKRSLRINRR